MPDEPGRGDNGVTATCDVLLIQPPIRDFYLTAKRTFPYGLALVAAALRRQGIKVEILDALATPKSRTIPRPPEMDFLEPFYGREDRSPFGLFHCFRHFGYSYEHMARQARDSQATLIGISSLFTAYSNCALQTAAAIRKACPQAVIVLGGHHPTALPHDVMQHPDVDYVLRGDGEIGLPRLFAALNHDAPLESVPGLVYRLPDHSIKVNPPAVAADLDDLPVAAFDLIPWRYYQRKGRGSLSISAGRGCPLRCSYCAVNADSYHGFRKRKVSSILRELKAACDVQPVGFINFEDEHLSADKEWFRELMTAIDRDFGHLKPELRAMNGLFAPSLGAADLALMQKAGFRTLNLALITTHGGQLKRFRRPDTRKDLDRVLALTRQYGMSAVVYLIVAGPQQDPMDSVADLLYLAERQVLAGVSVFYPAPGSHDYDWCRRQGLLAPEPGLLRATALPLEHVTARVQSVTLLRMGRLLNFMKQLIDHTRSLPRPRPAPKQLPAGMDDRTAIGRLLLSAFLHSGRLCGVDSSGVIYDHCVDRDLCRAFLQGLKQIRLQGA